MVSVNPNPSPGFHFFDPMNNTVGLPGLNSRPPNYPALNPSSAAVSGSTSSVEDSSKKIRKPYTITKSRESWTDQEHDKFLEALQLFDRDWKKIEAFVGSKTVIQIRSHAQKYFLKVQKSGASEHVPPPRPKRKASHPYPQKAPKNAAVVSQVGVPVQSTTLLEPDYVYRADPSSVVGAPITSASSWSFNTVPPVSASQTTKDDAVLALPNVAQNSCNSSSNESSQKTWPSGETDDVKPASGARVMPNFAQVYSFIGSVFDPNASGHLQRLKQMDPIDMETVVLLMKNLAVNLTSPEFEDHKELLSSYDVGRESASLGCAYNTLRAVKSESTAQSA